MDAEDYTSLLRRQKEMFGIFPLTTLPPQLIQASESKRVAGQTAILSSFLEMAMWRFLCHGRSSDPVRWKYTQRNTTMSERRSGQALAWGHFSVPHFVLCNHGLIEGIATRKRSFNSGTSSQAGSHSVALSEFVPASTERQICGTTSR